ncbi:MAG: DUF302 domain-containing protein [Rhodospirillaceae bacterium]|jgi:uncharacterized protein (DUF302 family)|nr:DUF302 domain-containing protein [Rhodospirillaceae bacterium]
MRFFLITLTVVFCVATSAHANDALVVKTSPHSVSKTLDKLEAIFKKKGITVFARIDHAAGAAKVGVKMLATQLLIFGNPKLGTPLMQSQRKIGLALPLKVLAWESDGKVKIAYTKPTLLAKQYNVVDRDKVFAKMAGALDKLTNAAIKP